MKKIVNYKDRIFTITVNIDSIIEKTPNGTRYSTISVQQHGCIEFKFDDKIIETSLVTNTLNEIEQNIQILIDVTEKTINVSDLETELLALGYTFN